MTSHAYQLMEARSASKPWRILSVSPATFWRTISSANRSAAIDHQALINRSGCINGYTQRHWHIAVNVIDILCSTSSTYCSQRYRHIVFNSIGISQSTLSAYRIQRHRHITFNGIGILHSTSSAYAGMGTCEYGHISICCYRHMRVCGYRHMHLSAYKHIRV